MHKTRKPLYLASTVLAALLATAPVEAHHSFSAEFDANLNGELTGEILEVRYSNPHVRYRIAVKNAAGDTEEWEIQAGSVTSLRQQGWLADSVKVGDIVTTTGQLGRAGAKKIFVRGMTHADGRVVAGGGATAPRVDPSVVRADAGKSYGFGQQNPDHPFDISGAWRNSYKFRVTVDDLDPKPTPFTAEGRRIFEATQKFDDPGLRCLALGLPRMFGNPYDMAIYDGGDHYLLLYVDHNSPRRIWMDGRTPPDDTPLTSNGFSVGRWESDSTLVIETTHLLAGWLDGSGLPMSGEGTRTVERHVFSDDRLSMDRTMTIHDPLYTQPLTRVRGSAREDGLLAVEGESCDPASYYVDLMEAGLLEEYLKP